MVFRPCCMSGACTQRCTVSYNYCCYNYRANSYYTTFKASKDITLPSGTTQIRFKGVRGAGTKSKMAVDEVYVESPSASFPAKCQAPSTCKKTEYVSAKADPRRFKDTVCSPRGACANGKLIAASAAQHKDHCGSCNKGYKLQPSKTLPVQRPRYRVGRYWRYGCS